MRSGNVNRVLLYLTVVLGGGGDTSAELLQLKIIALRRTSSVGSLDLIWALITFSTPWSRRSAVTELLDGLVPDVTSGLLVRV